MSGTLDGLPLESNAPSGCTGGPKRDVSLGEQNVVQQ